MIKAVIWDLDGTILDTTDLILRSYRYAFNKVLNTDISDEEAIGNFGRTLIDVMSEYSIDKADELIESYRYYNHANHDNLISPFPGILDALANIERRGFRQALVTSKTEWLAKQGLELFGLYNFFDFLVGFESTDKHKPQPEPIVEALRRFRLSSDETVFVGDSEVDQKCSEAAGVIFAAAMWGPNPDIIDRDTASWILYDPRDILLILPEKVLRI